MVLEIIIIKFSCILKMMSRNTFPEPQPDSASYHCEECGFNGSDVIEIEEHQQNQKDLGTKKPALISHMAL